MNMQAERIDMTALQETCPCCGNKVAYPKVDMVIDRCHISPLQAAVFRSVWAGKGYAVRTEKIFDAMYQYDPDGGPSMAAMYGRLKAVMFDLRGKLEGSGYSIVSAGYGRGYRLKIGDE